MNGDDETSAKLSECIGIDFSCADNKETGNRNFPDYFILENLVWFPPVTIITTVLSLRGFAIKIILNTLTYIGIKDNAGEWAE